MILYHGTSKKALERILQDGIQPRALTNESSLWETESALDRVYLSDTYALYYALSAGIETEDDAVVLKIDATSLVDDLHPDEDYLAQTNKVTGDILLDTKMYRDELYELYEPESLPKLGKLSLEWLGTCCVNSVSPELILEYTVIPHDKLVHLLVTECDPTVTIMHHQILGKSYKEALQSIHERFDTHKVSQLN